jgi:hypothetical protein
MELTSRFQKNGFPQRKVSSADESTPHHLECKLPHLPDFRPRSPDNDIPPSLTQHILTALHTPFSAHDEQRLCELLKASNHLGSFQLVRFRDFFRELLASNRLSNWGGRAVTNALSLGETFVAALPDSSPSLDLTTTHCAAVHFQHDPRAFGTFLSKYNQIQRAEPFTRFAVAFRSLIRHGAAAGEDILTVTDHFRNLIEDPRIQTSEREHNLLSYFRGLIWRDWDFVGSLVLLEDTLEHQKNVDQALRLCALSATAGRADSRPFWQRRSQTHVPAAVDFLAREKASDRELALATLLYHRAENAQEENVGIDAWALRLFTLLEVCRFTAPRGPEKIFSKVEDAILSGTDPSGLINLLTVNQLRSQDHRTSQKAIEGLIGAGTLKEFQLKLELLRSVYNADVPPYPMERAKDFEPSPLLERQNEIFKEAMNAFSIFRQARYAIDRMAPELRPSQGEHPGLLLRFAAEIGDVSRVYCEEGGYPGNGIVLSKIRATNVFEVDTKRGSDPYHHYLRTKGWTQAGIDDFLASRIMLTDELIVVSAPQSPRYTFRGDALSAVFFREGPGNTSGSQCFLVPTSIIDAKLQGCTFDFWDTPIASRGLHDLSKRGFYPEAFELEARQQQLPFFDIGSPTNIGGFSNSRPTLPKDSELANTMLNAFFGLQDKDPWGNPKKAHLIKHRDLFDQHLQLHAEIAPLVSGYSSIFAVFSDRYCAFKRGDTPDNSQLDVGLISELTPLPAGMVMLEEAYRHHCYLRAESAPKELFPTIRFFQRDKLHLGPVSNFELDTSTMQLTVADGPVQLPILEKQKLTEVDDTVVRALCVSAEALHAWQLYVRPHLGGLVPYLCFD